MYLNFIENVVVDHEYLTYFKVIGSTQQMIKLSPRRRYNEARISNKHQVVVFNGLRVIYILILATIGSYVCKVSEGVKLQSQFPYDKQRIFSYWRRYQKETKKYYSVNSLVKQTNGHSLIYLECPEMYFTFQLLYILCCK